MLLVETPHQVRKPGETALEHRDLEIGMAVEKAAADQAHYLAHVSLAEQGVVLDPVTAVRHRGLRLAIVVKGHDQAVACRGIEYRLVDRITPRPVRCHWQKGLNHLRVRSHTVDLSDRPGRIKR